MFKNKLNNYIFKEVIKSYLLVLFSLSLLIWIAQAAKYLNLITDSGLSIKIYVFYVILIFPKIFSQLMILSILISLFLTILKLQDNKEIEIYWLSGMSKMKFNFLILKISFLPTFLALFFYLYLVPLTNLESREILAKSEFSMVNSLVKKKNFNSNLKNLTIFVNENDNKGNLEKIYIFENLKTIISKKGRVLNINGKNYLELIDGFIHEKVSNNNIEIIKFQKTLFDFTKYQVDIVRTPKIQEIKTLTLIKNLKETDNKKENFNLLYELHKRFFKPLFIPAISVMCCFLLYSNNEKINLIKLKVAIFSFCICFIIFLEIVINFSVKNLIYQYIFYSLPFLTLFITIIFLHYFLKYEPCYK